MRNTKKLSSYNSKKYIIITVSENNPPSHIFILGLLLSQFMCVYVCKLVLCSDTSDETENCQISAINVQVINGHRNSFPRYISLYTQNWLWCIDAYQQICLLLAPQLIINGFMTSNIQRRYNWRVRAIISSQNAETWTVLTRKEF